MNNYKDDGEEIIVYNNFMNMFHLIYLSIVNVVINSNVAKNGTYISFFWDGGEGDSVHPAYVLYSEKKINV